MLENRKTRQSLLASGTITFTLGLVVSALGAESLAVYNACFANPSCISGISAMNIEGFFAILVAGLLLVEAGVVQLAIGLRSALGRVGCFAAKSE